MEDMQDDSRQQVRRWSDHPLFWPVTVAVLILVFAALKATSAIAIPVIFSFFVAIAIAPVDFRLRDALPKGARWIGHVASMLILIVILGAFFAGIGIAAQQVMTKFSGSIEDVGQMIEEGAKAQSEQTGEGEKSGSGEDAETSREQDEESPSRDDEAPQGGEQTAASETQGAARSESGSGGVLGRLQGMTDELGQLLKERGTGFAGAILNRTASFLSSLVLVLFLALFLLIETPQWREKAQNLLNRREESEWIQALDKTAESVRWFVIVKAGLGAVTAAMYAAWLGVMGVDLLFVWFLITFLLNFVPTFGSLISGLMAAGYAFYHLDFTDAVIVAVGLLVIEQIMGNYVEPRFIGRQLALSPLVVLVSLVLWTWLWGAAGALLATPILILVVVVSAHVSPLRPIAVLLSENGEESVQTLRARD